MRCECELRHGDSQFVDARYARVGGQFGEYVEQLLLGGIECGASFGGRHTQSVMHDSQFDGVGYPSVIASCFGLQHGGFEPSDGISGDACGDVFGRCFDESAAVFFGQCAEGIGEVFSVHKVIC